MEISFVGHSCFRLRGRDANVVTDPYGKSMGLATLIPSRFSADLLCISHDHAGHNNIKMVGGDPKVITGPGEYEVKGVGVKAVASSHDEEGGARLGPNTMFAITIDEIVVAHVGDLGHTLTEAQQEKLGTVDVLLLPVGGGAALSATQAIAVANQIEPKIVIPMHYKLPGLKPNLDAPTHFAAEMGIPTVEYQPKLSLNSRPGNDEMRVVFLEPRAGAAA